MSKPEKSLEKILTLLNLSTFFKYHSREIIEKKILELLTVSILFCFEQSDQTLPKTSSPQKRPEKERLFARFFLLLVWWRVNSIEFLAMTRGFLEDCFLFRFVTMDLGLEGTRTLVPWFGPELCKFEMFVAYELTPVTPLVPQGVVFTLWWTNMAIDIFL